MRRAATVALVALVLVGAGARAWRLDRQIPEDDEMHAAFAATGRDARWLFTHHATEDYSIPIALYCRALVEGPGLDEDRLRAPVLAGGMLLVVLFAAVLDGEAGPAVALVGAALAASSPLLVRYSRYARPYGLVALCALVAVAAALAWARDGRRRWAALVAAAGALALWLNVLSAPTIAVAVARCARRRGRFAVGPLAAAVVAAALLVGPGLPSLVEQAQLKAGVHVPRPGEWWSALTLVCGARSPLVVAWFAASAIAGGVRLWRRARATALVVVGAIAAQIAAVTALAPYGTTEDHVLARYAIAALPCLLWLVAEGVVAQARLLGRPALSTAAAAGALAALVALGPLPGVLAAPTAFTNHNELWRAGATRVVERLPLVYRFAAAGARGRVLEAPWPWAWSHEIYDAYQAQHRRPVVTVVPWRHRGWRFRTLRSIDDVTLAPDDLLVVHRDLMGEAERSGLGEDVDGRAGPFYRRGAEQVIARVEQAGARPAFSDGDVVVFAGSEARADELRAFAAAAR